MVIRHQILGFQTLVRHLIPAHAQRIRNAIDVVEPGRDQSDLQNGLVIETSGPQALMILLRDARRIASQLRYVVEHDSIPL